MVLKYWAASLFCISSVLAMQQAKAADQPNSNMGNTSFYDGLPVPGSGEWHYVGYQIIYSADKITDADGKSLKLPNQDTRINSMINQLIYTPEWGRFSDGHLVFDFLLPIFETARIDDGLQNKVLKAQAGIGDVMLGGGYQFKPIMGENGPLFSQRIELDFLFPLGSYSPKYAFNPGSNTVTFNPYYAFTAFVTPSLSISARLSYLWNAQNNRPWVGYQDAKSSQAGQAYNINFAIGYTLTPTVTVGLNGYFFKQFTDLKVDHARLPGQKEQVLGVGPGMMVSINENNFFWINYYQETLAENRSKGSKLVIRLDHEF
ncbi:hypothetical protein J2848_006959 [Azospirillum lipoferum]|uniref:Phenol degradation protein meta n=1 Tax=Azospirillum lipoferum TaxID=193 RepID=A0A5A9G1N1_AZOLI|nr:MULTISPECIES: transporter [Azospirillum]KAA0588438.1 phenol degradation protein meta [Azospirillum lipoferum]MCP1615246.1 hypothetical protein [Azospirillum lipoferum]MDW5534061.1 transporter [Azospirillum sp. NL1]